MVNDGVIKAIEYLDLQRMPTSTEIKFLAQQGHTYAIGLDSAITRNGGYINIANELFVGRKDSTTGKGLYWEERAVKLLHERGYSNIERMPRKHTYDILLNDRIKIDVKASKIIRGKGEDKTHVFRTKRKNATCDIYMAFAVDEDNSTEIYIIPALQVKVVTLVLNKNSKFYQYKNRWDILQNYDNALKAVGQ